MVYMNGNGSLESITDIKMNELDSLPSTSRVNILVQQSKLSQGGKAKRYHTGTEGAIDDLDLTDMASPRELKDFIRWSKEKFPADYYILNIFSHGGGWKGLLRDEVSGHVMDIAQLKEALSGEGVDIVSFSSCSMATVEVSYELKDSCNILISSQDDVPITGWPYDIILDSLLENPRQTPEGFSKTITDDYINYYSGMNMTNMSLSVIDLKKMSFLVDKVNDFLINNPDNPEEIKKNRENSLLFYNKNYIDTETFFNLIASSTLYSAEVKNSAEDVLYALKDSLIIFKKTGGSTSAKGISLYFSEDTDNMVDFNNNSYSSLDFGYNCNWEEFLVYMSQGAGKSQNLHNSCFIYSLYFLQGVLKLSE